MKKIYDHKCDNLDETDQFLERHNLPKLTGEETHHLNKHTHLLNTLNPQLVTFQNRKCQAQTGH